MINNKKVAITYGSFDPFHYGHLNLFKRIKEFADILIVGVATQRSHDLAGSGKVLTYPLEQRIKWVKETGLADLVIVEDDINQDPYDIKTNNVDYYVMGDDYKGRKDFLNKYCKVIYLPRTQGISSSEIKQKDLALRQV